MIRRAGMHLRVVWDREAASRQPYREPVQLSFMLERLENRVAIIGEGGLTGLSIMELLQNLQPYYFLDLRTCPRFDFVGFSRKRAFSEFARIGVRYLCLSGDEASDEMTDRVQILVSKLQQDLAGPMVVIVDREEAVEHFSRALPLPKTGGKAKSGRTAWEFTVAGLRQG